MSAIRPFKFDIPEANLDDLRRRLAATRWPERETPADWSQGAPLAYVQEICDYWRTQYDWRRCEARPHPRRRRFAPAVVLAPILAAGAVALTVVVSGLMGGYGLHAIAYLVATRSIAAGVVVAVLSAVACHVAPEHAPFTAPAGRRTARSVD